MNPERARFCLECGTPVGARCASCGTELPPAAKFGLACGAALATGRPSRDPRDYTPKHLADKILQSKSALEGERKQSGQAEADLDAAEQLVAETGARALLPAIHEARAALAAGTARERRLREAQRLYDEMGAAGHAERISRQLSGQPSPSTA